MKRLTVAATEHSASAVLYTRVSSKEQDREGFSLASQEKLLRDYAEKSGFRVAHHFVDVETAKQSGRGAFNEMLAFLKKNRATCRVLLVEKTDRLYRNIKDWVTLDELDLEIHCVKEGTILSEHSRSSEKFMHGIKVLMAKNFIDNLSEETRKGMTEKAEQGLWPSKAPLGYRNIVGTDGKKTIEPEPTEAPLIKRAFEMYATGDHSLKEMTTLLRDAGLVFNKSKSPVPRSAMNYILHNALYQGDVEWNGKVFAGKHTPLVSRELWQKVQDVAAGRNQSKYRKAVHDFAFSRLMTCGHCGCAIVGEIQKKKYVYYHCTDFHRGCPKPYVREEEVAKMFTALLKELTFDDEVLVWVREALRESHGDKMRFVAEALSRLQIEYAKLQARLDAMYEDKLDGRIDAAYYDRKAGEYRTEQARVRAAIEQHATADQSYTEQGIRLLELAQKAWRLFGQQPGTEQRKLLGFVLSNCTLTKAGLVAEFKQPFDLLRESARDALKKNAPQGDLEGARSVWLRHLGSNQGPCD